MRWQAPLTPSHADLDMANPVRSGVAYSDLSGHSLCLSVPLLWTALMPSTALWRAPLTPQHADLEEGLISCLVYAVHFSGLTLQ